MIWKTTYNVVGWVGHYRCSNCFLFSYFSLQLPDLKSWQKNSRSNFWNSALTVRQGEMVHQIRPGNKSEFAFMTRINSITPKLSTRFQSICRCCDNPNFSYYCSVYDKVFIETLQPEIHVRKISIKKQSEGTFESYSQRVSQM